jgi:Lon protease-like protein
MTTVELPLFPLDVVLFPGTVLPLYIFEPRYRRMIADCQSENKPFGIVLARPGSEHLREEPYQIGTMAAISDLDEMEDGRCRLMAIGMKRFRIMSQHRENSYLSAQVEPFTDEQEVGTSVLSSMEDARSLFGAYLQMLLDGNDFADLEEHLPRTPEALSHFIAYFLDIQNEQKQHYLELTSTRQRLDDEIDILRREVPFLRMILTAHPPDDKIMLN